MDLQPGQVYFDIGDIPFGQVDADGVDWAIDANGFKGWGATGSTREAIQKVRGNGAWSGLGWSQPRNMSIEGRFYAPTPELARAAFDRLNDQVSIEDTTMTVYEPGLTRHLTVYRTDEILNEWIMPNYMAFSIGIRADDHRKLWDPLTASTALGSSTGGLTFPHTFAHTFPAVTTSGSVSLINSGNEAGPVTMRIDGPVAGPVVTHVASGRQLVFSSSLVLGAGEWLDIDHDAKTVLANGQSSRAGYIISRGWSQFEVGANTWAFSASSFNPASLLTVTAVPADK